MKIMIDQYRLFQRVVLGLILLPALHSQAIRAQEAVAEAEGDAGLVKLDQLTLRMEAYLRSLPALEVVVQQTWRREGRQGQRGECEFSLRANHDGPFRLRIQSGQDPPIRLDCVGDGRQITRLYRGGEHRLISRRDGSFADLVADNLTASCLTGSGLDILCQPDIHGQIMGRVSEVRYLGTTPLTEGEAHHFRCTWDRSNSLEFWISADDSPLLLRQERTVATEDAAHPTLTIVSKYQWNRSQPWPPETFQVDAQDDFVRVSDLYTYLLEGPAREMIGKAAPAISLSDTSGRQHRLGGEDGKRIECLFFWTTWATASAEQKVEVYRLMSDFEHDPVMFYAVNVGESKQVVVDFLKQTGFDGTVLLDVDQQLSRALGITSLPVCVLIDQEGKVAAVHLGNTSEDRELVRRDLAALCGRGNAASDD
jgi:peroxiredoxin